ncbi:hypothetical protein F4859DRAFT_478948 [Xylaria cf. heliscus]|nr:hypothetical protein F4859DRAFT_478948 [Xylaria cf. heliscus]
MGTHYLPYIYDWWHRGKERGRHTATPDSDTAAGASSDSLPRSHRGNDAVTSPYQSSDNNMDTPVQNLPDNWRRTENEKDRKQFEKDRESFLTNTLYVHRNVNVKVCAVWDTVASLGLVSTHLRPLKRWKSRKLNFVNSDLCNGIEHAIQALSCHEHRRPFCPIVWRIPNDDRKTINGKNRLQQCWFMGYHSDIGGGVRGEGLSHYPLAWMMSKLEEFLALDNENFWNPRPIEMKWKIDKSKDSSSSSSILNPFSFSIRPAQTPRASFFLLFSTLSASTSRLIMGTISNP